MSRFFVPKENIVLSNTLTPLSPLPPLGGAGSGEGGSKYCRFCDYIITISGSDVNHIKNVLRKKIGDEIICFDSNGIQYKTKIESINKTITLSIISSSNISNDPKIRITLGQGLPKKSKMDEIIKKSCELGVFEIVPVICERSQTRVDKTSRWHKIAKESVELSQGGFIPEVKPLLNFDDFISAYKNHRLKLIPWEGEENNSLKNELTKNKDLDNIVILVGPEGGFSFKEIEKAKNAGFRSVSLGKRILRTESAAPAMIAMIIYEFEL